MKSFPLIFLFTIFFSTAQAETTQFFFQPDQGEHIIEPLVALHVWQIETELGKSDTLGSQLGARYLYGFHESFAAGVEVGFLNTSSKSRSKGGAYDDNGFTSQGLMDIAFSLKGRSAFGDSATLRYGADLSWSPEPYKSDAQGNRDNQMTGGNLFKPFLGIDFLIAGKHRVGGQVQRDFLLGKQVDEDSNGQQTKYTGGESTSVFAFYEYNWSDGLMGGGLGHTSRKPYKDDSGFAYGETTELLDFRAYANFKVSSQWTLVPEVHSQTLLDSDLNGVDVDTFNIIVSTFSARYSF